MVATRLTYWLSQFCSWHEKFKRREAWSEHAARLHAGPRGPRVRFWFWPSGLRFAPMSAHARRLGWRALCRGVRSAQWQSLVAHAGHQRNRPVRASRGSPIRGDAGAFSSEARPRHSAHCGSLPCGRQYPLAGQRTHGCDLRRDRQGGAQPHRDAGLRRDLLRDSSDVARRPAAGAAGESAAASGLGHCARGRTVRERVHPDSHRLPLLHWHGMLTRPPKARLLAKVLAAALLPAVVVLVHVRHAGPRGRAARARG